MCFKDLSVSKFSLVYYHVELLAHVYGIDKVTFQV